MAERVTTRHDIQRDELNTTRQNFSEVTQIYITGSAGMVGTGIDPGTGLVSIFVSGTTLNSIPYLSKNINYTLQYTDYVVDGTGTITFTVPTPVGHTGQVFVIKNSGLGVITINANIDGVSSITLNSYESLTIQSTGSSWIII